ncbi:hypothetical protein LAWI1_G005377 [Lachnellula willkommii]|uniref:Uncharacterized protein n=1 Tax=Lachnellula willkommii TaxID=215461 RepID=A0A559MCV9_9HELO|nr:hypothetical protein LAWI1_G005377 [Lachnellula willkommii]
MGANPTPLQKLKSQERLSKIPNGTAFIIYRLLPIVSLPLIAYLLFTKRTLYRFEGDTGASSGLTWFCGLIMWLDNLNSNIRMWIRDHNLAFGLRPRTLERERQEVQHEKERFAIYLAGSRQGIPPLLRVTEGNHLRILFILASWASFYFACAIPRSSEEYVYTWTTYLKFWIVVLPWLAFAFPVGKHFNWHLGLCHAGWRIRQECKKADVEKGEGDPEEQLKWWIEGILKEESDSEALAAERMEIIIAPILRLVRCEAKTKKPVIEFKEKVEAEKKAKRQRRDNDLIKALKEELEFKESLIGV